MWNEIKESVIFVGILLGAAILCGVVMSLVFGIGAYFEENGHQMINKTITVVAIDPGGSIIDENGIGYRASVRSSTMLITFKKNHSYKIIYFCDNENTRRISEATDLTRLPPTPTPTQDLTKCKIINGVCV